MLDDYRDSLVERRAELVAVRESLGDRPEVAYPAMVADWGLAYYDSEDEIVSRLAERLGRLSRPTRRVDRAVAGRVRQLAHGAPFTKCSPRPGRY